MYYIAEVMAPLVIKVIFTSCISPSVAPYSALVTIPEKPIFLADCAESRNYSNNASAASPVTRTSSINA